MRIETESIAAKFTARLSEIAKKSYIGLDGKQTPYIQAGYATAIEVAINDSQYPSAMAILTSSEERAGVVAKIRNLPAEKRESFSLPEAGSADEFESLKALSGRLANIARTEAMQTAQTSLAATLKAPSLTTQSPALQ